MGARFGNYEILRKVAAGGMAEVFLAKQTGLGGFERLVCIKRILAHLGEQDDFITMFQDEARIAANLVHPNIAQIYDIGEVGGSYYIAMEYVRGEDLRRVYNAEVGRARPMPLEPAAQVVMYAAAGLDYAHRQTSIDGRPLGIVHRDISPQNLLVSYDGHVKIVDFGVAKAAVKVTETRSGVLKGKYSYMSPEQASGDPIDARTDIFALGITLYEVTTGTRLFKRDNELETLHAVIEGVVTPPSEVIPGYDKDLETIILKALAYDRDDRYATAGEMERALERFLVARDHPISPSSLAAYMQDLFAEKLADELLFGGEEADDAGFDAQPHTHNLTDQVTATAHERTIRAAEATQVVAQADSTLVDDAWGAESSPLAPWGGGEQSGWGAQSQSRSASMTATHGGGSRSNPSTASHTPGTQSPVVAVVTPPARSRHLVAVALAAVLLAVGGVGAWWLHTHETGLLGPMSGPMVVDSEPRGARVVFVGDGASLLNDEVGGSVTPLTLHAVPVQGALRARFSKEGCLGREVPLPLRKEGVAPPILFAELPPEDRAQQLASLMLLSTPPGAGVWLNGNRLPGETPLTDVQVPGGDMHRLEFRKAGYKTRWETRYVEPGSRTFVEVNLFLDSAQVIETPTGPTGPTATVEIPKNQEATPTHAKAILSITTQDAFHVRIDGKSVGETPIQRLSLTAGAHRIELKNVANGYVLQRRVRLTPGKAETLEIKAGRGFLAVNATPWAWVRVGKEKPTETPAKLEVFEGEHVVVFECPDGRRLREQAMVTAGQTASVAADCRPSAAP